MAILLYCVAKSDAPVPESLTGVAGDPVVRLNVATLAAFTSSNIEKSSWLRPQLQASALDFHRVLNHVFKSAAVIPFRFPTVFDDKEQLIGRVQERANEYDALLGKFSDLVQMEIRITNSDLKKPSESGTQYLKLRQTASVVVGKFTAELQTALSALSHDWRERLSKDGTRAFILLARTQVADFQKTMRTAAVPSGLKVRVSGPWPATEFMEPF